MQRGLSRLLRDGIPQVNQDLSITVVAPDGSVRHSIPPSALATGGIGYVYERVVALEYEARGYEVEQRSSLGFGDRGIDLVCENLEERIFVQCKFGLKPFSVSKIEELLFKASAYMKQNLRDGRNYFDLVVHSDQLAFPSPRKAMKSKQHQNRAKFAFMRHNSLQSDVALRIREIEFPFPQSLALADALYLESDRLEK